MKFSLALTCAALVGIASTHAAALDDVRALIAKGQFAEAITKAETAARAAAKTPPRSKPSWSMPISVPADCSLPISLPTAFSKTSPPARSKPACSLPVRAPRKPTAGAPKPSLSTAPLPK